LQIEDRRLQIRGGPFRPFLMFDYQPVLVRYRPNDPCVNKLARRVWQNL